MEQGAGKNLNVLLQKYDVVFEEKLGTITPHKVQLRVKDGVRPKFCRTRQVPFALRATVDDKLQRLERERECWKKWMLAIGQHH